MSKASVAQRVERAQPIVERIMRAGSVLHLGALERLAAPESSSREKLKDLQVMLSVGQELLDHMACVRGGRRHGARRVGQKAFDGSWTAQLKALIRSVDVRKTLRWPAYSINCA